MKIHRMLTFMSYLEELLFFTYSFREGVWSARQTIPKPGGNILSVLA